MPLIDPRLGDSCEFNAYPATSIAATLGNPEQIIWSSILHLCSRGVAESVATEIHGVKRASDVNVVARNLKMYINQAHEFYEVAHAAKANTAPLIYYYSFLNLAKALCEIRQPKFHKRQECYGHGLKWSPNRNYLVNTERETVSTSYRGVWHALWESLTRTNCAAPRNTKLSIKDLFLYCPEISLEAEKAFNMESKLIRLIDPDMLYDKAAEETWIRFSVERQQLKSNRLTVPSLISSIVTPRSGYTEVRSSDATLRTFQSSNPVKGKDDEKTWKILHGDVLGMNVFCHLDYDSQIEYSIPLQRKLPLRMPQLMVLYTILFWLGSLVRYDPHSLNDLKESQQWTLIDGFISQSRLWLLEQFEWELYQTETTLFLAR